jgi:hypothetical protein
MVLGKKENIIVLTLLFILATMITYVQYHKFVFDSPVRADTGFLLEMTENIANGQGHISSIHAAMNNFSREWLAGQSADKICLMDLGKTDEEFRVVFESHRYYITYVVALFTKFFETKAVYYFLHVFGFFTLLYFTYKILRENEVSRIATFLFIVLVYVHPAFSLSLSGQLYAERLFIPFSMMFLYFMYKKDLNLIGLYSSAVFIALISERSPLMLGIFLVGYIVLFWKNLDKQRKIHFITIALSLLSFALYSLNVLRNASGLYYTKSTFLPSSLNELLSRLSNTIFLDNLIVFGVFSFLFLGVFSLFRWKLFLLAFVMMIPNIIGTIGGAEKYGYLTHYHTLYFPFLVFASIIGYIRLIELLKLKGIYRCFLPYMVILIILSSLYSPYSRSLSMKNIVSENALLKDFKYYPDIFNEDSSIRKHLSNYEKIDDYIPDGSRVTSGEMAQAILWKNKINYFYPMGIDIADYAVLYASKLGDNKYFYSSAVSYKGAEEAKKIDICIIERMHKLGYDFENQLIINNFAIIKRKK